MSIALKAPIRLMDSECEKGQLSKLTYLVATKEEPQVWKVKLQDGFILSMSIYSHWNTKEYLAHIVAVLHIIKQKGLDIQSRKLGNADVKLTGTFKDLLKAAGSAKGHLDPSQRYSTIKEEEACWLWPEKKWLLEKVKEGVVVVPKRKLWA
jgi:hypothetical protein